MNKMIQQSILFRLIYLMYHIICLPLCRPFLDPPLPSAGPKLRVSVPLSAMQNFHTPHHRISQIFYINLSIYQFSHQIFLLLQIMSENTDIRLFVQVILPKKNFWPKFGHLLALNWAQNQIWLIFLPSTYLIRLKMHTLIALCYSQLLRCYS